MDGRSDQFSLGIMAYELLTGKCPFAADSIPGLMYQILQVDPFAKKPEHPALTPPVVAVLAKGLAKNAQDRFPTCSAFIGALKSAMFGTRVATASVPVGPPPPPVAPKSKSAAPVAIAAVAALVLLAGAGYYWFSRGGRSAGDTGTAAQQPTEPPLIKAIQEGKLDDARALLQKGDDVNAATSDGTTPLMAAAEGNAYLPDNVPALTLLLEKGARIDAQDKRGRTALYRAVEEGKENAARLLLERKASLQLKTVDGATLVHAAVTYGRMPILKLLLQSGVDCRRRTIRGPRR